MKCLKSGYLENTENKIKTSKSKVRGKSRKTNRISKKEVPRKPCITVRM